MTNKELIDHLEALRREKLIYDDDEISSYDYGYAQGLAVAIECIKKLERALETSKG
jgi:hypothetical protein